MSDYLQSVDFNSEEGSGGTDITLLGPTIVPQPLSYLKVIRRLCSQVKVRSLDCPIVWYILLHLLFTTLNSSRVVSRVSGFNRTILIPRTEVRVRPGVNEVSFNFISRILSWSPVCLSNNFDKRKTFSKEKVRDWTDFLYNL